MRILPKRVKKENREIALRKILWNLPPWTVINMNQIIFLKEISWKCKNASLKTPDLDNYPLLINRAIFL